MYILDFITDLFPEDRSPFSCNTQQQTPFCTHPLRASSNGGSSNNNNNHKNKQINSSNSYKSNGLKKATSHDPMPAAQLYLHAESRFASATMLVNHAAGCEVSVPTPW